MGVLYTWVAGLVLLIVLWSIGAKAFDALLLTLSLLLVAIIGHIVWPHLPGNRPPAPEHADNPPYN